MKRENFIKIIKLRSFWKIDKRKGNYKLPNGERFKNYIYRLVKNQMLIDDLGIRGNGKLCFSTWDNEKKEYRLSPPFEENENCSFEEMEKRIDILINEII